MEVGEDWGKSESERGVFFSFYFALSYEIRAKILLKKRIYYNFDIIIFLQIASLNLQMALYVVSNASI